MEYMRNFKWPSIYRVACPMYLWIFHFSIVSDARNAQVTFVVKPQMKIISFSNEKHGYLMQYLIRKSFIKVIVVNQHWNYVCSHFKPLNWFCINLNALQVSVLPPKSRIRGFVLNKSPYMHVILKWAPSPLRAPPSKGGGRASRAPSSYAPVQYTV